MQKYESSAERAKILFDRGPGRQSPTLLALHPNIHTSSVPQSINLYPNILTASEELVQAKTQKMPGDCL